MTIVGQIRSVNGRRREVRNDQREAFYKSIATEIFGDPLRDVDLTPAVKLALVREALGAAFELHPGDKSALLANIQALADLGLGAKNPATSRPLSTSYQHPDLFIVLHFGTQDEA